MAFVIVVGRLSNPKVRAVAPRPTGTGASARATRPTNMTNIAVPAKNPTRFDRRIFRSPSFRKSTIGCEVRASCTRKRMRKTTDNTKNSGVPNGTPDVIPDQFVRPRSALRSDRPGKTPARGRGMPLRKHPQTGGT